jgi:hypothetical protein
MTKTLYLSAIAFIIFLVTGCSKEYELNKSVFIPDPDFPDLPAYTEWGYNTFGAFYERQLFLYSEQEIPAKIIFTGGITSFILKGQKNSYGYYYWDNMKEMNLTFRLPDIRPESYSDLTILDKMKIDLGSEEGIVTLFMDGETFEPEILQGELEFKRVQQLYVDTEETEVILSGVFSFQALVNGEPVSLSEGRFDVGIGNDNFFKY